MGFDKSFHSTMALFKTKLKPKAMKAAKTMTIMMAILFFFITAIHGAPEERGDSGNGELQVVCSPELEGLANQLASAYRQGRTASSG